MGLGTLAVVPGFEEAISGSPRCACDDAKQVKVVKVKVVKVMFSGLENEFDHFDFDRNDCVTALHHYSSKWALREPINKARNHLNHYNHHLHDQTHQTGSLCLLEMSR